MSRRLRIAILVFGLPAVPVWWLATQQPEPAPRPEVCAQVVWIEGRGWVQQPVSTPCQTWCKGKAWYEVAGLCRCQGGEIQLIERQVPCEGNVYISRGHCPTDVLLEWPGGQQIVETETCVLLASTEGLTARCYEPWSRRSGDPVEPMPRAPCL